MLKILGKEDKSVQGKRRRVGGSGFTIQVEILVQYSISLL